jgi:hypothetical protein
LCQQVPQVFHRVREDGSWDTADEPRVSQEKFDPLTVAGGLAPKREDSWKRDPSAGEVA